MVTRTIRQLIWTDLGMPKGRPATFAIDAVILKVMNGDPTASMCEIAQEAKLPASAVFYVLTTRMGYTYRRCRLVLHDLSEPQKINHLRQSHKLLEMLQNAKGLRWRFILMGDDS
jgi:hypothetical protein